MVQYKIPTKVIDVSERTQVVSGRKEGDDIVFEHKNLGWFVRFEDSWESLFFGFEKPNLKVGQLVDIVIIPRER